MAWNYSMYMDGLFGWKAVYLRGAFLQQASEGRSYNMTHGQEQNCQRICRHRLHRTLKGAYRHGPDYWSHSILEGLSLWESPLITRDPQGLRGLWSHDMIKILDECNDSYYEWIILNYASRVYRTLLCSVGSLCSELCTKTRYYIVIFKHYQFPSIAQIWLN